MTRVYSSETPGSLERDRFLPLLIVLFMGSGAAALIYEIVWFQMLQLVIGSTALSLAVLLGTFMGGMCLGSLAAPRIISPHHHPLRVYALLELGIAVIGLLVLLGMSHIAALYTLIGGYGPWSILLRAGVPAIFLLPPTILMGATLPAIGRWVEANPRGVSWLGFFYGSNIAGAVFGCLLAGFYLLRMYDVSVATFVAAGINVSVAGTGFLMARKRTPSVERYSVESGAITTVPGAWAVYAAIALSGLAALGAQAVWTRVLSLMLGGSTYTFSIILSVFLVGLGLGSTAGSALARWSADPRRDLGICQMLAAVGVAWSAYMMANSLPYWPIDPSLARSPWLAFQLDLFRSTWAVLPAGCFWGASFPLALAAAAMGGQDTGRLVGGVYAANTIGAIIGAVFFSVLFIQWFGTRTAQQALIGISAAAALLAIWPFGWPSKKTVKRRAATVMAALLGAVLMFSVAPLPDGLIAYGRFLAWNLSNHDPVTQDYFVPNILYVGEGLNASVAVSETSIGIRNFHVSGKTEASTSRRDMRLQRMLGHLPGLIHPRPRSVLIVGLGAGVTAGSFVNHPSVDRIVICEIEPLIAVVSKYFAAQNYNVLEDPRVEIVYDDARHYLLTTGEQFDIITSDPIHPWVKGAASLYTREYFELMRRHLNPGGVVSQWVPLYQSSMDVVKSELATFFEIFSGGTVWSNDVGGRGYDIVLLGRDSSSTTINADEVEQRLNRRDHVNILRSLQELGFESAMDLLATYAGRHADLAAWLDGAEINRDRNLRLQYLAGMGLNLAQEASIYDSLLRYRRAPEEVFAGSPEQMEELRRAIDRRRPRTLTESQAAAISKALATGPPAHISVSAVLGDPEALQYATQLRQAIAAGGWQIDRFRQSLFTQQITGLLIFVGADPPPSEANVLFQALRAAGLTAEGNVDPAANPDSLSLVVGAQR